MSGPANPPIRLTTLQRACLAKVCATNGGGVRIRCKYDGDTVVPINRIFRRLYELGLIQGKAGSYERVVHTRAGWDLLAERAKGGAE